MIAMLCNNTEFAEEVIRIIMTTEFLSKYMKEAAGGCQNGIFSAIKD
jgi:hypothetical protein